MQLEGHLQQDTDYGWGILGKLNKGGWVVLEQADVGGKQWRIVHVQMEMTLRILFKTKIFDTVEQMSHYAPVPAGMDYRQAIQMLRAGAGRRGADRPMKRIARRNKSAPSSTDGADLHLKQNPDYILANTITRVNRVRDSISARPRTRKVKMPARAPGLRATASTAEPTALPWPRPQRPGGKTHTETGADRHQIDGGRTAVRKGRNGEAKSRQGHEHILKFPHISPASL